MAIAEAIISALAAVFAVKGIDKLESKNNADGSTSVIVDNKKVADILPEIGIVSSFAILEPVVSTATKRDSKPTQVYENNLDADQKIFGLSFTPNSAMKTKGNMIVHINERLFAQVSAGQINVASWNIPIPPKGIHFARGSKIEIFMWNSVDATQIEVIVDMLTGV